MELGKVKEAKDILGIIKPGDTLLIGGFIDNGTPCELIMYLLDNDQIKDVTIVANDTGTDKTPGIGQIIVQKKAKKLIASHIGTNRETGNQMNSGELDVTLVPQGSLIERIRSGGYGLGGVLTKTGLGLKEIEEGKEIIEIDGEDWLLEKPITGDVALVHAKKADTYGNLKFHGSSRNYGVKSCFAADTVIVQVDEIVEEGGIGPDFVDVPGTLVDMIVKTEDIPAGKDVE